MPILGFCNIANVFSWLLKVTIPEHKDYLKTEDWLSGRGSVMVTAESN